MSSRLLLRAAGCSSHRRCSSTCLFSTDVLPEAHQSSHPRVLTHSLCHKTPCISWQSELGWGFIWPRKSCSNKIKVYVYPIGKGPGTLKRRAWPPQVRRAAAVLRISFQAPTTNQTQPQGAVYCKKLPRVSYHPAANPHLDQLCLLMSQASNSYNLCHPKHFPSAF